MLLKQCRWNWFEFLDQLEEKEDFCEGAVDNTIFIVICV